MVCLHGKVIVMILSFKDALVAIAMNIRNKVSCNRMFQELSSSLFNTINYFWNTIKGSRLLKNL